MVSFVPTQKHNNCNDEADEAELGGGSHADHETEVKRPVNEPREQQNMGHNYRQRRVRNTTKQANNEYTPIASTYIRM